MSMNPIVKFVVAALLLTGSAAGALMPAVNNTPAATPTAEISAETTAELTAAEATAIALTDAGLTEADVTRLKTHRELDDDRPEWEVEFRSGDWEYDYTIHAETGVILERDKEYDPQKTVTEPVATEPAPTEPVVTEPVSTAPVVADPVLLTETEAAAIALADAGLAPADVTGLHSKFETDDGRPEWEVEFRSGDWEYDYTIHAETGVILERDKEYDPQKTVTEPVATEPAPTEPVVTEPVSTAPVVADPVLLTREEAIAIALTHAGLTADHIRALEVEFDVERSGPEWSVEFQSGGWEYEYEIHAETGAILEWDKEFDD